MTSPLLQILDISDNAFTGKLPNEFFMLPNLTIIAASVNCLSPQLPASLCNSSSATPYLSEIYLNGLQQSDDCDDMVKRSRGGLVDLSPCIWSRSSLSKLYISGNGYVGKLDTFNLTNIKELGLGSNHLSGSLPLSLNGLTMEYFDISSNHFSGSMNSVFITAASNTSTVKVNVNRLSGPMSTMDSFLTINVLDGNIISCSSLAPRDQNYATYKCRSSDLEVSIYFWLFSLGIVVCIIYIFSRFAPETFRKWCDETSERVLIRSDEIKSQYPRSVHFLYSLTRLQRSSVAIVSIILVFIVVSFCPMKYSSSPQFSSHTYQYQYFISGLFLKSSGPAFVLVILHSITVCLLVGVYYIVFVVDWSVIRFASSHETLTLPHKISFWLDELKECPRRGLVVLAILVYMSISVLGSVLYVFMRGKVDETEFFFIQLSLQAFNGSLRIAITPFVDWLFPGEPGSEAAALVTVSLLSFVDVVTPLIATMVIDNRCFHHLITTPDNIDLEYSYETCLVYKEFSSDCIEIKTTVRSLDFTPPFVYSGECRDAVMMNFLPVVIISSVFQGFCSPLLNFLVTSHHVDLKSPVYLLGLLKLGPLENLVLTGSRMRSKLAQIWASFLMLLSYGILSPYAAVAIGTNTVSQIMYLRASISRYYHLYSSKSKKSEEGGGEETVDAPDECHLEEICKVGQATIHVMIWPGIILSSIVFALYVFDMAYDSNDLALEAPTSAALLTLLVVLVSQATFYYFRNKLKRRREEMIRLTSDSDSRSFGVEIPGVINPLTLSLSPEESKATRKGLS